jgi:hypothetical protein
MGPPTSVEQVQGLAKDLAAVEQGLLEMVFQDNLYLRGLVELVVLEAAGQAAVLREVLVERESFTFTGDTL